MTCAHCGHEMTLRQGQVAHRMPQTRRNLEHYGAAVIHDRRNLARVCSLACNDGVSISNHPLAAARLLAAIYEDLAREQRARVGEP